MFGSIAEQCRGELARFGNRVVDLGAGASGAEERAIRTMRAFRRRTKFLAAYDWVIYSGSYGPMAVHNHPAGRNILYCHTIPRFAYDLRDYYRRHTPVLLRPALWALGHYVRRRYERAFAHMDAVAVNSENVQTRVQAFLGGPSRVIYPPCDTAAFRWLGQADYYLSTARAEPYKRLDTIVKAFAAMPDRRLIVTSGGSELAMLRRIAAGALNIEFTGWVSKQALAELVGRSIATIYLPRDEDFGLSPVESMAAGKPVIGVDEGGLRETIVDGETGMLLPSPPSAQGLTNAVRTLGPRRAQSMRTACEAQARRFEVEHFQKQMRSLVRG